MIFVIVLSIVFNSCQTIDYKSDRIECLPGLEGKPNFSQYSGYLSGGEDIHLHYWLVESQANPSLDPVVLWLNGGPGESSLWGMFMENGPFRVQTDTKTLATDPNSWNTLANVLYLSSPVGVGFSYQTRNDTFNHNDGTSVRMNLKAIQDFFAKFPQFKANRFFIVGESYGGVYAPTLALEMLKNHPGINLRGVAIGNGWVDSELLKRTAFEFAYYHGLVDQRVWTNWVKTNCNCTESGQVCDVNSIRDIMTQLHLDMYRNGISSYNLNDNLCSVIKYNTSGNLLFLKAGRFFSDCPPDGLMIYLNGQETRKALHIPEHVQEWKGFRMLQYEDPYTDKSMKSIIKEIIGLNKLDQFIMYYGDQDMICDFIGGQRFVEGLGLGVTDKQKPWKVNDRFGGTVKRYEDITFVKVNNAGHSVPMDRPDAGLSILKELIGISNLT